MRGTRGGGKGKYEESRKIEGMACMRVALPIREETISVCDFATVCLL